MLRGCDYPHSISMNREGATHHADTILLYGDINLRFLSTKVAVKAPEVIIVVFVVLLMKNYFLLHPHFIPAAQSSA